MIARRHTYISLAVYLNSLLVGWLHKAASGAIDFRYDESWLALEHSFPVSRSLPLREDRYIGPLVETVFDNLLPDNFDIRDKMAARTQADGSDTVSLLRAVGRDCVGAMQFLPEGEEPGPAGLIDGHAVSDDEIGKILANLGTTPLGVGENRGFRISLAGAQEKTALLYWNNEWRIPHGTTATTHILKPEIGQRDDGLDLSLSVENEHLCMRLIAMLGLPAADTRMEMFGDKKTLIVERFDRHWAKDGRLLRLPQEDCCQALSVPSARKYESDGGPGLPDLLDLFMGSDRPEHDRKMIMKAAIVFWLLAAIDGHAKNFSLFLHPNNGFSLTPFYDVLSLQPNFDAGQLRQRQLKMAMAVGKNRHYVVNEIMPRHFLQTAAASSMGESIVREIFEELLERGEAAVSNVGDDMPPGFPEPLLESVTKGFRRRLHLLEHWRSTS